MEVYYEGKIYMKEKQVRRLLVLNSSNKPVGILSISDIAVKMVDEHLACRVLGKVCEPAHSSS